ncbi:hypothetical protein JCM4814A_47220 [Streptomyces phaeofaciens JCM 4814]|uniref:Uncharacterized protein n=1 Tax=Streptomyces phaeofaciens TaxID=68254 RepID=A0A918H1W3_9ACTN|nr:hypothetical protein GCM10010226_03890 [Streptomyces phaeofaciens]
MGRPRHRYGDRARPDADGGRALSIRLSGPRHGGPMGAPGAAVVNRSHPGRTPHTPARTARTPHGTEIATRDGAYGWAGTPRPGIPGHRPRFPAPRDPPAPHPA